jgi:hypothetical protein
LRFFRTLRVTLTITLAFSNSDLISFLSYVVMFSEIVPVELRVLPAPALLLFATLAFAAWKMEQIAFPPANAQGQPSVSARLIMASLKV